MVEREHSRRADPPAPAELAVVIPTLEEEARLWRVLRALRAQRGVRLEVVVADGGSTDATCQVAREAGARVVRAPRGRGRQMNAGARACQAEWLLFLHADSVPADPDLLRDALEQMRREEARAPGAVVGHFALVFEGAGRREWPGFYRGLERKSALNRSNTTHGDQGLWMRRSWFEALGGFDEELGFLEDQRLIATLEARGGHRVTLGGYLKTSTRRFAAEGVAASYLNMALILMAEAAGLEAFWQEALSVYPGQHQAVALKPVRRLGAFVGALAGLGSRERRAAIRELRGLAERQLWQVPFWLDVRLWPASHGPTPLTSAWDGLVARCLCLCSARGADVKCRPERWERDEEDVRCRGL
ncbi:glycosyltransferase [Lujinxingia litoralis]|uniref:glycosyltransferase n=1 Tax=Lujinxingia litoralis TaxID=2211119 RepID=UPI00131411F9|nr:glycosyltransferase [Lujinxingia litoralis]